MLWGSRIFYDVNLFVMHVTDLLVAERVGPDAWVGRNAGAATHRGAETELQATLIRREHNLQTPQGWLALQELTLRQVVTLSGFFFDDFSDRGNNYSGNRIPGVPAATAHTTLTASWQGGLYLALTAQHTGRMAMNDLNSRHTEPYQLFNAMAGLQATPGRWTVDLFVRVNNLADRHHASMILVNAPSFGGAPPRYYYPGLPRHWSSGARVSLKL